MTPIPPKQMRDGLRRFASMQAFRDLRVSTRASLPAPGPR
jgi:hypothetical protein